MFTDLSHTCVNRREKVSVILCGRLLRRLTAYFLSTLWRMTDIFSTLLQRLTDFFSSPLRRLSNVFSFSAQWAFFEVKGAKNEIFTVHKLLRKVTSFIYQSERVQTVGKAYAMFWKLIVPINNPLTLCHLGGVLRTHSLANRWML